MSSQIRESSSHSHTRTVEVLLDDPDKTDKSTEREGRVAHVTSHSGTHTSTPWVPSAMPCTPPAVFFERGDGLSSRFTRAQWETIKPEVDAAFSLFEATWPLAAAGAADFSAETVGAAAMLDLRRRFADLPAIDTALLARCEGPGGRHRVVIDPGREAGTPICDFCSKLVGRSSGLVLLEAGAADFSPEARAWFSSSRPAGAP